MLLALYEQIAGVEARERLRLANAVALGSGNMRKDDHRAAWRALEARAGVKPPRRAPTAANLALLGIRPRSAPVKP